MEKLLVRTKHVDIRIIPCLGLMAGYDKEDNTFVLLILPFLFVFKIWNIGKTKKNKIETF